MKDIKSILIGILGTACVFLFLGTTSVKDNESSNVNVYNQVENETLNFDYNEKRHQIIIGDYWNRGGWYRPLMPLNSVLY